MLAQVCQEHGYTIVNFADELKRIICIVLNISIQELESRKDTLQAISLSLEDMRQLEKLLEFGIEHRTKTFSSIRQLMQWLGTDVIRAHDSQWHIKQIQKRLKPRQKIVFADCRFENELDFVRRIGGECWYVMRPWYDSHSNHETEILSRMHFNDKCLLNIDKETLISDWKRYLKTGLYEPVKGLSQHNLLHATHRDAYTAGVLCGLGKRHGDRFIASMGSDKKFLYYSHTQRVEISPVLYEDLKMWRTYPAMYGKEWLTGFIDSQEIEKRHIVIKGDRQTLLSIVRHIPERVKGVYKETDSEASITWNNKRAYRLKLWLEAEHWCVKSPKKFC